MTALPLVPAPLEAGQGQLAEQRAWHQLEEQQPLEQLEQQGRREQQEVAPQVSSNVDRHGGPAAGGAGGVSTVDSLQPSNTVAAGSKRKRALLIAAPQQEGPAGAVEAGREGQDGGRRSRNAERIQKVGAVLVS